MMPQGSWLVFSGHSLLCFLWIFLWGTPLIGGDMPKGALNQPLPKPVAAPTPVVSPKPAVEAKNKASQPASTEAPDEAPKTVADSTTVPVSVAKEKCYEPLVNMLPNQTVLENTGAFLYLLVDNSWKPLKTVETTSKTGTSVKQKKSPQLATNDPKESKEARGRPKKTLVRFHVDSGRFEPLVSLSHKGAPFLMINSGGISTLNFLGYGSECGAGKAMIVSVSLKKGGDGNKAVHQSGTYSMIRSNPGWILGDLKKKKLVETDGVNFQMRTEGKLLEEGEPIFYDPAQKTLVHWYEKGDLRGILLEKGAGSSRTLRKIAVPKGEHILTSALGMGIIKQTSKTQVSLETLKGLTAGSDKTQIFPLISPVQDPLSQLSFEVHFEKERLVAMGKSVASRKQIKKAWVYELATKTPIQVIDAPKDRYVHFAALAADGEKAFFELRHRITGLTDSVKVYDFLKKTVETYPFKLSKPAEE